VSSRALRRGGLGTRLTAAQRPEAAAGLVFRREATSRLAGRVLAHLRDRLLRSTDYGESVERPVRDRHAKPFCDAQRDAFSDAIWPQTARRV
jgi:hypothetical protein